MKAEAQARGVLTAILEETARSLSVRGGEEASWEARARSAPGAPDFSGALRAGGSVAVIAEVKRRSPSSGAINPRVDAGELARHYVEGGAAAVSVLTEAPHFGGSLEDLVVVAARVGVPVLRKDFIISPFQLFEARAMGASAVLLIVRALEQERLLELARIAGRIGLSTLVEVHEASELDRALAVSPSAVGVNARDLETLLIEPAVLDRLLPLVPQGVVAVAESGIAVRRDVERVAGLGADAVLVGTALAGAADPAASVRELAGVAARARGARP